MPQTLPIDPPSNRLDQLAPKAVHVLGLLATLGAVAFMALLAVRPINSPDIGYHLAYGEHFLATGQIVQTNKWVFTPLDPKIMTDPAQLGPGCSFDAATNTYRFVNANWLSQAAMAAVKRVGGMNGLVALQAGLIVLLAVLLVVAMRRHGAPWHWVAPGVLMVALITDVRMPLRPELFGLPILVAQWALLSGKRFEWKHLAGVTVLQILMVNLHSYFLLGIAMAGAIFVQRRLEWLKRSGKWFKVEHLVWVVVLQIPVLGVYGILGLGNFWTILLDAAHIGGAIAIFFLLEDRQPQQGMETVGVNPLETGAPAPLAPQPTAPKTPPPLPPLPLPGPPAPSPAEVAAAATRFKWAGLTVAALTVACLVNPFGIRGAILPIQTVRYLSVNHITGAQEPGEIHPWATVVELHPPWQNWANLSTREPALFIGLMALAAAGAVIAILRKRWGWAEVLAMMALTAAQADRNLPSGAIIILPAAIALLSQWWAGLRQHRWNFPPRLVHLATGGAGAVVLIVSVVLCVSVVTDDYYLDAGRPTRMGLGASRLALPLEAAEWIDRHNPAGHIYTPYTSSSNLMYFTNPHRDMPTLSNTWAFPPYLMLQSILWEANIKPRPTTLSFEQGALRYDIETVVAHFPVGLRASPLVDKLMKSPDWALVQVGAAHVIFLRRDQRNMDLILECGISERTFNRQDFIDRCAAADPFPWYALNSGATMLAQMGWPDHAAAVYQHTLELRPDYPEALAGQGGVYAQKGIERAIVSLKATRSRHTKEAQQPRDEAYAQWELARPLLQKAIHLRPGYIKAVSWSRAIDKFSNLLENASEGAPASGPAAPPQSGDDPSK